MSWRRSRNQRGAGNIGCLLLALGTGAALYAGYMYGMPHLRHRSFDDRITENVYNLRPMTPDEMRAELIKIAAEFDIALTPAQVKIEKTPSRITIHIAYDKHVDLQVHQETVHFTIDHNIPL